MNIQFIKDFMNDNDMVVGSVMLVLWLLYAIAYWRVLWLLLLRKDFETNDRILWFLIITMAPFVGLVTYWFLAHGRAFAQVQPPPAEPVDWSKPS